ncbi:hypothetical protein [Shewanella woodyi]|uniref:Uncharacterized protein n=1 Tax=Shewanella woodyi (strain ATCC 51908 / MS32) TaxID=392500 RepID=B1KM10_SHEWM|nr:hypothetical protein [Shewanella woodyi]ACA88890.1 conserved hypothetical protein [Shewanella woodyi ATCC 51908]
MASYQIIDEPRAGRLSNYTVNPMWPLLSAMLGGPVFSWLWYLFNSFALNGPNRLKEILTIFVAFAAFIGVYQFGASFWNSGYFVDANVRYFYLFGITVQFVFSYILLVLQSDSFELYEHFNGHVASPVIGFVLAFVIGKPLQLFLVNLVWGG